MRKYLEVKRRIVRLIESREFSGKIPGERVLSSRFGYSYMTFRHAIDELVDEGYLYRIPRIGTFVTQTDDEPARIGNVGFYIYDGLRDGINSPYYSIIYKKIRKELISRGYGLQVFSDIRDLDVDSVDGIIATAFPEMERSISEIANRKPVILIENEIKGSGLPCVIIDNFNSTYRAIEYAIQLGHRRIGYVAGLQNSLIGMKRLAGYRAALSDYRIEYCDNYVFFGDYGFESGLAGFSHYQSLGIVPTFVHCANDLMALGFAKGCMKSGIRVPGDMSICGFDNIELSGEGHSSLT
ncbi:MAG TPA: GntR family transcriptional regulator, partial [Spirochaetota bacterium]